MASNPKLIVLFEKMRGQSFELTKDQVSAGRKDGVDICIKDGSMSSHHCDFIKTENGYMLRDNDSTNGTRVNNEPITECMLKNSDIIQLGAVEMLYDYDDGTGTRSNTGTVSRTHTIDLDSTELNLNMVKDLSNFSPFADAQRKKQEKIHRIMLVSLIISGVLLIGFVGFLMWKIFFGTGNGAENGEVQTEQVVSDNNAAKP